MSPLPMPTPPLPCGILAGSREEAQRYAESKRLADWYFVESVADLEGRDFVHIEMTGKWRHPRPGLSEILARFEVLRAAGRTR